YSYYGKCASLLSETALRTPQTLLAKIWDAWPRQYTAMQPCKFVTLSERSTARINIFWTHPNITP
ncbi:hypothetical protein, partial [Vibrio lentus]|uniref:hypothetical protein n=1 Tax=Vibrio lentus TaxID=136468 RepID=UPI001A7E0813